MKQTITFWEQLSFGTHPCLEEQSYDGWLLRFANGYTKRANSVTMLKQSTLPLKEKIAYCEKMYKKQELPAVFKITPLSINVDNILAKMGYAAVDKTNVMTLELSQWSQTGVYEKELQQKTTSVTVSVTVNDRITEAWQNYYFTLNHVSMTAIPTPKMIQGKIVNPLLCATIYFDKKAVACGLGVLEQNCVGLLDIIVSKEHRGLGLGKLLCQTLLIKAKENGATTGYLQVVDNNVIAKHLYESLGFVPRYSYWYRMQA